MSLSTAFYQVFYQNDTLFQLEEIASSAAAQEKPLELKPKTAALEQVPAAITKPVTPAIVPLPVQHAATVFPELNHKILILTDDPKSKNLIANEALLLNNILKAVGHSAEKTDILNFSFLPGADARQVLADKSTNYFITFGVPLIKLHLDLLLVPYAPKFLDGIWFLLADPLVVIDDDKALKKKLWLALQKMFEKA
jgi:hypothetical protein